MAISGTYQNGAVLLKELPPIDEPREVMVVFLPQENHLSKLKTAQLFGIAKNNNDNDIDIEQELCQLSKNTEQHILDRWDRLNNE